MASDDSSKQLGQSHSLGRSPVGAVRRTFAIASDGFVVSPVLITLGSFRSLTATDPRSTTWSMVAGAQQRRPQ